MDKSQLKIFEFNTGEEKDYVLAKDEESALKCLQDFHSESETDRQDPEHENISLRKVLNDAEWDTHKARTEGDDGEDEYQTFREFVNSLELEEKDVPYYLCGTMW